MNNQPSKRGRKPKPQVKLEPLTEVPSFEGFGLNAVAQEYWLAMAPQLIAANILTELHIATFAELCRYYAEHRMLAEMLASDPGKAISTTANGYSSESPYVRMRDKAFTTVQRLWPKFGLHPESLAKMRKHGGISATPKSKLETFGAKKYQEAEDDE